MVGYQMHSMPNEVKNSRYGESTLKGGSLNTGERYSSSAAPEVLDTGSYLWKCNIWGNGDLSAGVLGRNSREPHAVRENNSASSFRSPESLTSYDSLLSSSEAEGCSHLPLSSKRSGFHDGQRSQLEYASSSEVRDIARQHSNSHAVLANRSLSKSPGILMRDQSFGRISSRLPNLLTETLGKPSHRANISPSNSAGATFSTWTEQVSPTESRTSLSNYPGLTSRATSHSSSLPPSQQSNDPVAYAHSLESLSHGRMGNKSSVHTPYVTLTEPVASSRTNIVPSFQGLSMVDDTGPSLLAAESNSTQGSHFPAFDRRYAVQTHDTPRKLPTYPHSYSPGQGINANGSVLPHQFVGYSSKHRNTYPLDHRLNPSSNSTIQQSPFYTSSELSPSTEYNHFSARSTQQIGSLPNSRSAAMGRDLRNLQEQQSMLDPQLQQIMASAQAQAQLNSISLGSIDRTPLGKHSQSIPVSSFYPVVSMQESFSNNRDQDSCTAVRSTLMHEFKSNNRTNKRYELKDIFEHIAEFSGDQHGSRFIQQKLENATSDEKEKVFQEIQPNTMQLACDVFGNYVIQKLFEHGDQNQKKILANRMKGHVLSLSLQTYACRVVQKAFEHILVDQQVALIKELESHVIRCVKDQNGNHVIQKAIERLPSEHIQFIIDAFAGQVQSLASHSYGCRVIQRLLEHAQESPKRAILQELHACVPALISDQFGNYVTQHMIEHGGPKDRAVIINMIQNHLISFATHKFASNVVEKGLVYASDEQRRIMLNRLLQSDDRGDTAIGKLIQCAYGNYVLQKFLDTLSPNDYATFIAALQPELHKAKRMNAGNGVKNIPAIVKKMRRFDGPTSSPQEHAFSSRNLSLFANSNNSTLPSTSFSYNNISVEAA